MIYQIGQRLRDKRTGLTGTVADIHGFAFYVIFDDDAKASTQYAAWTHSPAGKTYPFTLVEAWELIGMSDPVPMPDTRDYLQTLISLRDS